MDFLVHAPPQALAGWKVLLVDDEPEVHEVTRLVLGNFRFEDRPLDILSAMTAEEAKEHLAQHDDIAVILLDVVMENDQAGLKLVEHIRHDIGNRNVRIVLRTGQPGQAPEHEVIIKYDINDYKEKTELTSQKLATTLFATLRSYRDIMTIEANKRGLERVISASAHIFSHEKIARIRLGRALAAGHADRHGHGRAVLQGGPAPRRDGHPNTPDQRRHRRLHPLRRQGRGRDAAAAHRWRRCSAALADARRHLFRNDHYVLHFTDSHHTESLLYVGETWNLSELDIPPGRGVLHQRLDRLREPAPATQELFDSQLEMIYLLAGAAEIALAGNRRTT